MTDVKTIKEIANSILSKNYEFDYVGIRIQEELFGEEIGQELNFKSYVWDDGNQTDELLNGICAINAKTAKRLNFIGGYMGRHILVLGCDYVEYGNDSEEIIMNNPIVLDILYNNNR